MKEFFKVVTLDQALGHMATFPQVGIERVALAEGLGRCVAATLTSDMDLPGFRRSTMDGFALEAASTFGASGASPALLEVCGAIEMGTEAANRLERGQAARILTGGMLPPGADSVVMIEHTEALDEATIEVTRSVAPGQHVIEADEDVARGDRLMAAGHRLRPQDIGLLAALGHAQVEVFQKPVVAILSTGDEVVPVGSKPTTGQVRDVNSHTLCALVTEAGGEPRPMGIVGDDLEPLTRLSREALHDAHMVIISGGSSVGSRDLTLQLLEGLPDSEVLFHGVAIKPGKPTILARVGTTPFWGLPGHVASAMVVFRVLVRPYLEHLSGACSSDSALQVPARLSRNIASAHGRREYIRVKLEVCDGELLALPILGKSGLIRTMVAADGVVEIDVNTEGLTEGTWVRVLRW